METTWINDLKNFNMLDILIKEYKNNNINDYLFKIKSKICNIINLDKNILIVNKQDFNDYFHNSELLRIGILDEILIDTSNNNYLNNLFEDKKYWNNKAENWATNTGILKYIDECNINNTNLYKSYKILVSDYYNKHSKIYVLGENLAFNELKNLNDIQNKNSKYIFFSYLTDLDCYIIFLDSYSEVIREEEIKKLSFTEYIEKIYENNQEIKLIEPLDINSFNLTGCIWSTDEIKKKLKQNILKRLLKFNI